MVPEKKMEGSPFEIWDVISYDQIIFRARQKIWKDKVKEARIKSSEGQTGRYGVKGGKEKKKGGGGKLFGNTWDPQE